MPEHPPSDPLLSAAFGRSEIPALRHLILVLAADAGMPEPRRHDLVLAIDELTTNVVRHGGGRGQLQLWLADGRMWFRVSDRGPGLPGPAPAPLPPATETGGRGLWIADQVTDTMSITTGPRGTSIVGAVALPSGV